MMRLVALATSAFVGIGLYLIGLWIPNLPMIVGGFVIAFAAIVLMRKGSKQ